MTRGRWRRRLLLAGGALAGGGLLVLSGVGAWVLLTDRWADGSAAAGVSALQRSWSGSAGSGTSALAAGGRVVAAPGPPPEPGSAFALLRVPRLGAGWVRPVIEGTSEDDLRRGVGHYPGTALPGTPGNFAVAGHRTTWGHPFGDIDRLVTGDEIEVETAAGWYDYRVTGHQVVRPDDGAALAAGPGATITLTACHPRWSARLRWVVHGVLVGSRPRAAGRSS